jgi:acyl-CoA dehydrogenase
MTTLQATADTEIIRMAKEACEGVSARFDRAYIRKQVDERGSIQELWDCMATQGIFGLGVGEEHGGAGVGITGQVAAMEELSSKGIAPNLFVVTTLTRAVILAHGTEDQIARFVLPTVTGEKKFCFALTEPNAGTNTFGASTRATRLDDGSYRINGQKVFITGVDDSELLMVGAKTKAEDGTEKLSLFVVDLPAEGIELSRLNTLTYEPERQFIVHFDNLEVPAENRIGAEGAGAKLLFSALNPERYMVSSHVIGLADLALSKAVDYSSTRAPFGKPIGGYQAIQHPLASAKAHLEAAKLMMYQGCAEYDAGINDGVRANMTSYLASEASNAAIEAALQSHGGYAFDLDYDLVTLWPVIRLGKIAPINQQMLLNFLGERVLGLPRSY